MNAAATGALGHHQPQVLVVDDNPMNLKLASRLLELEGYDVLQAASAVETGQILVGHTPDLIIMDLHLPDMDGLELTRRIKADPRTHDVPVVALTAAAMKGDEQSALKAGCDGYLSKPVDTRSFGPFIAAHIHSARVAGSDEALS